MEINFKVYLQTYINNCPSEFYLKINPYKKKKTTKMFLLFLIKHIKSKIKILFDSNCLNCLKFFNKLNSAYYFIKLC
jgi:hypothetical protein